MDDVECDIALEKGQLREVCYHVEARNILGDAFLLVWIIRKTK